MTWSFVPTLPTKHAWDTRPFTYASSLEAMFRHIDEFIKAKPQFRLAWRGQVAYYDLKKEAAAPPAPPLQPGELPPSRPVRYVPFSGLRELRDLIKEHMGEHEKEIIQSVIFYQWGWFRH